MIRYTTKQAAEEIARQYGGPVIPDWKMRRTCDALAAAGTITIQRVQLYRTISPDDVGKVAAELQRLGWLPKAEVVPC